MGHRAPSVLIAIREAGGLLELAAVAGWRRVAAPDIVDGGDKNATAIGRYGSMLGNKGRSTGVIDVI